MEFQNTSSKFFDWQPGQLLQGRHKVIRELGHGSASIVLEVEDVFIFRKFAMKLFHFAETSPSVVARLEPRVKSQCPVSARSDIYSLGCVMFEALTGSPPFAGSTSPEIISMQNSGKAPSLREACRAKLFSWRLEKMIASMLENSPSDRPQNCNQLLEQVIRQDRQKAPGSADF